MKKIALFIYLIIIPVHFAQAVDNDFPADIRFLGMGVRGITGSALANPAAASRTEKTETDLRYHNRYAMKGTSTVSFSCIVPARSVHIAGFFSSFGDKRYRDTQISFSVSKLWSNRLSTGIGLTYRFVRMQSVQGVPAFVSAAFGATYQPVDNVCAAVTVTNVPAVSVGNLPFRGFTGYALTMGCSWQVIRSVRLVAEAENTFETAFRGGAGVEYTLFSACTVRVGIGTAPLQPCMGAGYDFGRIRIDAVACYHPELGVSTGVGLKMKW
ncbi:MAG: hypothetical protein LIP00_03415 [Parabacteroides sp.]|nr:hypothetical protein [Parabacteroides sp.]